jgi:hypothetical protein
VTCWRHVTAGRNKTRNRPVTGTVTHLVARPYLPRENRGAKRVDGTTTKRVSKKVMHSVD